MAVLGVDRRGGVELRYAICVCLLDAMGPVTVPQLVAELQELDIVIPGRASKTVSDALRWEVRKGRAIRLGRGRYATRWMPRSTEWWIRREVARRANGCRSHTGETNTWPAEDDGRRSSSGGPWRLGRAPP